MKHHRLVFAGSIAFALVCLLQGFYSLNRSPSVATVPDDPSRPEVHVPGTFTSTNDATLNHPKAISVSSYRCFDSTRNQTLQLPTVPHFILVGTQKGGTSALRDLLVQHPKLIASKQFEPHFFDSKLFRYLQKKYKTTNDSVHVQEEWLCDILRHYQQFHFGLLEQAQHGVLFYEKTPSYLVDPDVPLLIRRICPWKPKIVVMLRDPIERAFSHYKMEREKKRLKTDFTSALNEELVKLKSLGLTNAPLIPITSGVGFVEETSLFVPPANLDEAQSHQAHKEMVTNFGNGNFLQRGMYSAQLQRWLEHFSLGEDLLVLTFEELQANPSKVYNDILKFVGAPHHVLNAEDYEKSYRTRGVYRKKGLVHDPIANETRRYLEQFFAPYNHQLESLLGRKLYSK